MVKKKKRNYNSKKKGQGGDIKKIIITWSWFAVVLILLFFVGRYFLKNSTIATQGTVATGNLCEVKLSTGITEEVYDYKGFRVYFNSKYRIPNCVSYELIQGELNGEVPRAKNFDTDPHFIESANPWDYTHSGYDRGHMAPAADMKWDKDAMMESFYMSNVCPQSKALNTGAWHKLENKVRAWAERDSALIVVAGPILSNDMTTIGERKVAVPNKFFKIILAPYGAKMRAIAFIYDNKKCSGDMKNYVVTVDSVESITGHDFFSALPDDIEDKVESVSNFKEWNQR